MVCGGRGGFVLCRRAQRTGERRTAVFGKVAVKMERPDIAFSFFRRQKERPPWPRLSPARPAPCGDTHTLTARNSLPEPPPPDAAHTPRPHPPQMGNQLGVPARPTPDMVAEVPGLVFKEALGESGVEGLGRREKAGGTAPTPQKNPHTLFYFPPPRRRPRPQVGTVRARRRRAGGGQGKS